MCKKLAEIGVETIREFRDLPVTTLENTAGVSSAQVVRDLCFGIDPSPVIPTGPPQVIRIFYFWPGYLSISYRRLAIVLPSPVLLASVFKKQKHFCAFFHSGFFFPGKVF